MVPDLVKVPVALSASDPHVTFPFVSAFRSQLPDVSVATRSPPVVSVSPVRVEEAVVPLIRVAETAPAKVDVPAPPTCKVEEACRTPETRKLPSTVDEADETKPLIRPRPSMLKSVEEDWFVIMSAFPL